MQALPAYFVAMPCRLSHFATRHGIDPFGGKVLDGHLLQPPRVDDALSVLLEGKRWLHTTPILELELVAFGGTLRALVRTGFGCYVLDFDRVEVERAACHVGESSPASTSRASSL